MQRHSDYLVVREVATNELRICRVVAGYRPPADPAYTWGGPFPSQHAARKAVEAKSDALAKQLYPEGYTVIH
jgi:hypothetical protein